MFENETKLLPRGPTPPWIFIPSFPYGGLAGKSHRHQYSSNRPILILNLALKHKISRLANSNRFARQSNCIKRKPHCQRCESTKSNLGRISAVPISPNQLHNLKPGFRHDAAQWFWGRAGLRLSILEKGSH